MTIDLIVRETLERELADVSAALAVVGAVSVLVIGGRPEPQRPPDPVTMPAMNFDAGLRGFYDAGSGLTHLGGQTFDLGAVKELDTSASVTPYGLVFFGANQSVRLLPDDGRVRTIAAAPVRPEEFSPTVKYDPGRGLVAWLTKADGKVTLSVYEFGAGPRLIGSYPVPCAGSCSELSVAGVDQGLVFVRGDNGSRLIDPAGGPEAGWTPVTDGWVADVRNRVVLSVEESIEPLPPVLADTGWRLVAAQGPDSLLTFDGAHELSSSTTLASTSEAVPQIPLAVPLGVGQTFVNLDSDGSVLVARSDGDTDVFWDCALAGTCEELTQLEALDGDPTFLGKAS